MPSVTAEEAPRLRPYMKLAEQLGSFAGQLTETGLQAVTISYAGHAASLNTRPLTQVVLTGLLRPLLASVNMVNAPALAKQRNVEVRVVTTRRVHDYQTLLTVEVVTERRRARGERHPVPGPAATAGLDPRHPGRGTARPHMLYVRNQDKPGLIGALGRTLGDAGINIATFHLGRDRPGGDAIALVEVDGQIPDEFWPRSMPCRRCCTSSSCAFEVVRQRKLIGSTSTCSCTAPGSLIGLSHARSQAGRSRLGVGLDQQALAVAAAQQRQRGRARGRGRWPRRSRAPPGPGDAPRP